MQLGGGATLRVLQPLALDQGCTSGAKEIPSVKTHRVQEYAGA